MQVCGRHFDAQAIQRINAEVASVDGLTRHALSRRVCDWLGWVDARGQRKEMSARVALSALARRGLVQLPAATRKRVLPATLSEPVLGPSPGDDEARVVIAAAASLAGSMS